ncbi:MAG TPA: glycine oxidase ThiO [Planctomycetota bacterium]|nr:glycine oxidase ThiO [Planctomycetota bacterium]
MSKNPDVLVIGGGIVGSAIAWRLAKDGLSVTLLEKGEIGREASWAAGGMLTPVHLADYPPALVDLCSASLTLYEPLCREILAASGVDPEYRVTGLLLVVTEDGGEEAARELEVWKRERNQPVERLSREEAIAVEPEVTPLLRRALRLPDIAQIRNNRMAVALAEGARRKGAEIRTNTPVTGFLRVPGRVNGVKTPRGDIYAGTTILAAGAWSPELLKPLGLDLKVKPIKGQIVLAGGPPDLCRHMLLDGESYLIPRADGRILVGSTLEDVGFDKSVILETVGDLALRGARLMPALGKLPLVTSWAGLRPATPDRLPYLGKGPVEGLIVATGHYRNGILLAPITAELVADLLAGQAPSIDLAAFDPMRIPAAIESAG